MDKDKRKSAAAEKARLKAEYKKIMNEHNEDSTKDKKRANVSSSSSASSSASKVSNDSKRKRDVKEKEEMIDVGVRVKVKFEDGEFYEGIVTKIKRNRGGEIVKIGVEYDDGDEEECKWPDKDIDIIGRELVEKKTKKKKKERGDRSGDNGIDMIEVERGGIDIDEEGTRIFTCGEPVC